MRLLIVDESEMLRGQIVERLSRLDDLAVVQASNSLGAWLAIDQWHPDLVILDFQLKGGGGLEVLNLMQREGYSPAVIMLSNSQDPAYERRSRELGASRVLNKSAGIEQLKEVVHELLAGMSQ